MKIKKYISEDLMSKIKTLRSNDSNNYQNLTSWSEQCYNVSVDGGYSEPYYISGEESHITLFLLRLQ